MLRFTASRFSAAGGKLERLVVSLREYEAARARESCKAPADFPMRHTHVIGLDEAGNGAMAGPIIVAAAYVPPACFFPNLFDSKALSEPELLELGDMLMMHDKVLWRVASYNAEFIDRNGTAKALRNGTEAALRKLVPCVCQRLDDTYPLLEAPMVRRVAQRTTFAAADAERRPILAALMDGDSLAPTGVTNSRDNQFSYGFVRQGDALCPSIAAASVIARTVQTIAMRQIHVATPEFGFDVNKGYPTAAHYRAIDKYGFSPQHRLQSGIFRDYAVGNFSRQPQSVPVADCEA